MYRNNEDTQFSNGLCGKSKIKTSSRFIKFWYGKCEQMTSPGIANKNNNNDNTNKNRNKFLQNL